MKQPPGKPPAIAAKPIITSSPCPLPPTLQCAMGQALGADFSFVRVHTQSEEAVQLQAQAFTRGEDLYFAPGRFQPHTARGRKLIGHELTHVTQQRAGRVSPTAHLGNTAINANPVLEAEADQWAERIENRASEPKTVLAKDPGSGNDMVQPKTAQAGPKRVSRVELAAQGYFSATDRQGHQRSLFAPVQAKRQPANTGSVVQMKTDIKYQPDLYQLPNSEGVIVGSKMRAELDPSDPKMGSEPGPGVQKNLMGYLKNTLKFKGMIRGHLLNGQLGGLGIAPNLFPITSRANSKHKNHVENKIKEAVAIDKKKVLYTVDVNKTSFKPEQPNVFFDCLVENMADGKEIVKERIESRPQAGTTGTGNAVLRSNTKSFPTKRFGKSGWGQVGHGLSDKNISHQETLSVINIQGMNTGEILKQFKTGDLTGSSDIAEILINLANELYENEDAQDKFIDEVEDLEKNDNHLKLNELLREKWLELQKKEGGDEVEGMETSSDSEN